ncbi:MAG: VWA domain-containing protein [Bacteroidia bacterium]|nr:VWA domain-containing protein [Bacteroidia bacterium]
MQGRNGSIRMSRFVLRALLGSIMICSTAYAQPTLNFKRVIVNWPTIELYFSVACDGSPAYTMTQQHFRVYEEGSEIQDFTLWCPDPTDRCAVSVAMVMDASASMSATWRPSVKTAGHAFVDLLDGVVDEAAIVFFNQTVEVRQQMTTNKPMLHSAVDALYASGIAASMDGIHAGVLEVINRGVNPCRAVIALTDGYERISTHTAAEIIDLANRHRIKVFAIGYGNDINRQLLQTIALQTGGRYYETPTVGQLAAIYLEISTILFQQFQECLITYQGQCADSSSRTVELSLLNFCGGDDAASKGYTAPLLSPRLFPRDYVPNELVFVDSANTYVPNPFSVRLTCTNQSVEVATDVEGSIILPDGLELDPPGQPVRKLFTPSTMKQYTSPDPIPELLWTVRWTRRNRYDVNPQIRFTVTGKDCRSVQIDSTEVRSTIPIKGVYPSFVCDAFDLPDSLALNAAGTDVEPNPFTVRFTIKNKGNNVGRITRLFISFPSTDGLSLDPSSPNPMNQTMNLELDRDESRTFEWMVKVEKRITRRVPMITVVALDDEGNEIRCEDLLPIAGVGTVGSGSVPLPTATRLEQNRPNPFNPTTTIEYHLGEAGEYSLTLYDALGRMLRVLDSGYKPAGTHSYVLDASDLPSGVYLYKLETAGFSETKRMIFAR